ncbi:MAG: TRAP transporter small permease [Ruminiclostridium sp.]|nr:TRAP transporter small permease [Ruminiclostridium sp.]
MKKLEGFVIKTSQILDNIAGWGIVATMTLVVVNILLRALVNKPIQGVYEVVGFLTAVVIAFGLAWCAIQKAHIAIEFIVEKMHMKLQKVIHTVTGGMIMVLLLFISYRVFLHGFKVIASGEVSATAQIPFYPFIFMVGLGFVLLFLVEFVNLVKGVEQK